MRRSERRGIWNHENHEPHERAAQHERSPPPRPLFAPFAPFAVNPNHPMPKPHSPFAGKRLFNCRLLVGEFLEPRMNANERECSPAFQRRGNCQADCRRSADVLARSFCFFCVPCGHSPSIHSKTIFQILPRRSSDGDRLALHAINHRFGFLAAKSAKRAKTPSAVVAEDVGRQQYSVAA